ncbi:hypothetical protein C8R45DRAFT_946489 [Mycena sanguinolenta]|nr:hypothetical protein C8R45DRAFT_946489 [Mycena sanguinolenta]
MVLQLNRTLIYNVYLLPESTQWTGVLGKDPWEALAASIALAYTAHIPVMILGDLNARTAALLAKFLDPPRTSMDTGRVTARGKWLCEVFKHYSVVFISGAQIFGPNGGKFTSFQGKTEVCRTVIDYAACSRELFSSIRSFTVAGQVQGYDHAALIVEVQLDVGGLNRSLEKAPKKRKVDVPSPEVTELDKLFIRTLEAGKDEAKRLRALYGPVLFVTTTLKVTIHGSCLNSGRINATAGSAAYWGQNARQNMSARVWGTQTGPRAELLAVWLAIKNAPLFTARTRTAPLHFRTITRECIARDGYLKQAMEMARNACDLSRSQAPIEVEPIKDVAEANNVLDTPKVTADIENNSGPGKEPPKPARALFPLPHRGRDKLAAMQDANRKKILDAPSRAVFWKVIMRLADPRSAPISVTADELKDVFERRLNPPAVLPPQFDSAQHRIDQVFTYNPA